MEHRFTISAPIPRFAPKTEPHSNISPDEMLSFPRHDIVLTGEFVASAKEWMRGHGTFLDEDDEEEEGGHGIVRSSVIGTVERVNKLISVRALRGRYKAEVGDLIVGRICDVQAKRWKVDAGARQDAVLMLGSVNLPGGVQRRKLESDELQMRTFFQEGDLLVAEVQAFFSDGAMSLHTRSLKYGKLRNGILVQAPSQLVVRMKSHFISLSCGVDLIVGLNGNIWVSSQSGAKQSSASAPGREGLDGETLLIYTDENEEMSASTQSKTARVALCISIVADYALPISDQTVAQAYDASLELAELPDALLKPEVRELVALSLDN